MKAYQNIFVLLLLVLGLTLTGCGGPKGVIHRVQELQPEAEKREREIEELSGPEQGG